ncbi:MAG: glycosyltransferase [Candidatus Nanoarchaeia archaeon]|nr:glycosyltransferase [Candidatus Nanoarchaeia archaeon]
MVYFSAIIPTLNEERIIEDCILSFRKNKDVEIIVIDCGSSDKTVEIVKKYPYVKLLHTERKGHFHQKNVGVKHAKGKVLLFMDADIILSQDFFKNMKQDFKGKNVGMVMANVIHDFPEKGFSAIRKKIHDYQYRPIKSPVVRQTKNWKDVGSVCLCVKKEIFQPFDERSYYGFGDWEFCSRMTKYCNENDIKILVDERADAVHFLDDSIKQYFKKIRRAWYFDGVLVVKNKMYNRFRGRIIRSILSPILVFPAIFKYFYESSKAKLTFRETAVYVPVACYRYLYGSYYFIKGVLKEKYGNAFDFK